jgi:wyosine [tRNA(Phe)-imidazoG37] synthetase (radical SAM superfamily)
MPVVVGTFYALLEVEDNNRLQVQLRPKPMSNPYQYIYGPVPSRRLGRSLGVDLVSHKTCCLDCVFCQLGATARKTLNRQHYAPTDQVIRELKSWCRTNAEADYITLSGSGEPTLHIDFGMVLAAVKTQSDIPAVLLSNGALFDRAEVREAACQADIVKISLSAWDQASFEWINRPHPDLAFDRIVSGYKVFRREFKGQLWLEVFLMLSLNARPENVRRIAALAKEIAPDRIHLNTVTRPAAESFAMPLTPERLSPLTELFEPRAEIISEFAPREVQPPGTDQDAIMAILKRRPCTSRQIADACGLHFYEVTKYLATLIQADQVRTASRHGAIYYVDANREVR